MTLGEKIIDLFRKGYTVRFQATEIFPDRINIALFKTFGGRYKGTWFETIAMSCEYGIPPEEEIVGILGELEENLRRRKDES